MKKLTSMLLALVAMVSIAMFSSCSKNDDNNEADKSYYFTVEAYNYNANYVYSTVKDYLNSKLSDFGTLTPLYSENIFVLTVKESKVSALDTRLTDLQNNDTENLNTYLEQKGFSQVVTIVGTNPDSKTVYNVIRLGKYGNVFGTYTSTETGCEGYILNVTTENLLPKGAPTYWYKATLTVPNGTSYEGYLDRCNEYAIFNTDLDKYPIIDKNGQKFRLYELRLNFASNSNTASCTLKMNKIKAETDSLVEEKIFESKIFTKK